jgi:serpin B
MWAEELQCACPNLVTFDPMKAKSNGSFAKHCIGFLMVAMLTLLPSHSSGCSIRQLNPKAPTSENALKVVTASANEFGLKLYKGIARENKGQGQFFSPFSIYAALGMVIEGASGQTQVMARKALRLPGEDTIHAGMLALNKALSESNSECILAVANAVWPQNSMNVKPLFLETIRSIYLGQSTPLDLRGDPEGSRTTINEWVEEQTRDRIVDLLPSGSINSLSSMILTNAIYFKGDWEMEFEKKNTKVEPFFTDEGSNPDSPLMYRPNAGSLLKYSEYEGVQVVELPYEGNELSMVVMLPRRGTIGGLESKMNANKWETIRGGLHHQLVNVWLPSFKMNRDVQVQQQLIALGLGGLFTPGEYSNMFESPSEFAVDGVFHKAFVAVNEEGTEAAAATAFGMVEITSVHKSPPPVIYNFRADHPFLFFIQHRKTGAILFMGKVMNPAE